MKKKEMTEIMFKEIKLNIIQNISSIDSPKCLQLLAKVEGYTNAIKDINKGKE